MQQNCWGFRDFPYLYFKYTLHWKIWNANLFPKSNSQTKTHCVNADLEYLSLRPCNKKHRTELICLNFNYISNYADTMYNIW